MFDLLRQALTNLTIKTARLINAVNAKVDANKSSIDAINSKLGGGFTAIQTVEKSIDDLELLASAKPDINDSQASAPSTYSSEKIESVLASIETNPAVIDDETTSTSKTYSSSMIQSSINSLNQVVGNLMSSLLTKAEIIDSEAIPYATYSSSKIESRITEKIANAVDALVGGADAAGDTLKELLDQITAIKQAESGLVSAAAPQTFTDAQKLQAQINLGLGVSIDSNGDNEFVASMKSIINADLWALANA